MKTDAFLDIILRGFLINFSLMISQAIFCLTEWTQRRNFGRKVVLDLVFFLLPPAMSRGENKDTFCTNKLSIDTVSE